MLTTEKWRKMHRIFLDSSTYLIDRRITADRQKMEKMHRIFWTRQLNLMTAADWPLDGPPDWPPDDWLPDWPPDYTGLPTCQIDKFCHASVLCNNRGLVNLTWLTAGLTTRLTAGFEFSRSCIRHPEKVLILHTGRLTYFKCCLYTPARQLVKLTNFAMLLSCATIASATIK